MRSFFVHISASSSAVFCLSLGFFGFGIRFGTILVSIWLLGSQKGAQGGPQGAKGTPRGGQRGAKEAKGRPRVAIERRKGAQGGPKGGQGRPKGRQREAKRRPGEAILAPFSCPWRHLRTLLGAWPVFGSIFGSFLDVFSGVFFNCFCLFSPSIFGQILTVFFLFLKLTAKVGHHDFTAPGGEIVGSGDQGKLKKRKRKL